MEYRTQVALLVVVLLWMFAVLSFWVNVYGIHGRSMEMVIQFIKPYLRVAADLGFTVLIALSATMILLRPFTYKERG